LGGSVTFGGTASLTFALPATLAGNSSVTVENTAEFGAGIGQTGGCYGLTKAGSGALVLRGLSSYTGTTAVEEGRLVIEGALVSSPVEVNRGATLLGGGSVGPLTIRQGGVVSPGASPGTLSSGPQVWESGGVYLWEINRAEGNKGADPGWDWFNVSGTLTIAATREAPFTIRITSLTPGGNPGPVADFDSSGLYSWPLLSASEGITGFDPQMFALDRSGFANDLGEGRFELSLIGNDLALAFVPEPAAWGLIGGALALLAAVRKRVLSRVS
jgi:autotransporter-associated beta strand protein